MTRLDRSLAFVRARAVPVALGLIGVVALVGSGGGDGPPPPARGIAFISLRSGGSVGTDYYGAIGATGDTLSQFLARNGFDYPPPPPGVEDPQAKASYFNAGDLDLGRDMHCLPRPAGLACYVTNYTALDTQGQPIFSDDPGGAFQAMHAATPFATVAMEYIPTPVTQATVVVRECDGDPTGSVEVGDCGLESRPPFGVGEIRDPAPGVDVDTGIDLQPGDQVEIVATGTIDPGFAFDYRRRGPNGDDGVSSDTIFPMHPGHPFALIGRVGGSSNSDNYFFVGDQLKLTYSGAAGRLFLRTNDDTPGNGWGHFDVKVVATGSSSARFYVYGADGALLPEAVLDSEGPKQVPGVCLACHGGRYDAVTHTVRGASFLPFNTKSFKYDTQPGLDRRSQEGAFRRLNALVRSTRDTTPGHFDPTAQYIDAMYAPLGVETPGAVSLDDFVPPGWASLPGVYRDVIRPYCAGCHLALGPNLDFTDSGQLTGDQRQTVLLFLCKQHMMPHSEVAYRHFWTDDLGEWPNYVARPDTLNLDACAR